MGVSPMIAALPMATTAEHPPVAVIVVNLDGGDADRAHARFPCSADGPARAHDRRRQRLQRRFARPDRGPFSGRRDHAPGPQRGLRGGQQPGGGAGERLRVGRAAEPGRVPRAALARGAARRRPLRAAMVRARQLPAARRLRRAARRDRGRVPRERVRVAPRPPPPGGRGAARARGDLRALRRGRPLPARCVPGPGGFDARWFCYLEDIDLGFRMRLRGMRCVHVPDAVVRHVGSSTTGRESAFQIYHSQRNLVWTWVKDMPAPLLWLYLPQFLLVNALMTAWFVRRGLGRAVLSAKVDALRGLRARAAGTPPGPARAHRSCGRTATQHGARPERVPHRPRPDAVLETLFSLGTLAAAILSPRAPLQPVPVLRHPSGPLLRRPRHVAAGEPLPDRGAAQRDGAVLPAPRARLRALLPGAARGVRDARTRSSPTTPTSRPSRRAGSSTAASYVDDGDRPLRARRASRRWSSSRRNDGYLLQYFAERGVPVLGVEPAANVARGGRVERGIPTVVEFFGRETARTLAARAARRPADRQQRARPRARPERLRRRA